MSKPVAITEPPSLHLKGPPWSEYLQRWLDDPDGGAGAFSFYGDQIRAHDPACESLRDVWMPRRSGKSCLSDWTDCDTCGLTIGWDGVGKYDECDFSYHTYCYCCAAKNPVCDCKDSS